METYEQFEFGENSELSLQNPQLLLSHQENEPTRKKFEKEQYVLLSLDRFQDPQPSTTFFEALEYNSTDKNELLILLKKWGVDILYTRFIEEDIDVQTLKYMTSRHCEILTKGFKLGVLIKLEYHLKNWQNQEKSTVSFESSKTSTVISHGVQFDLFDILQSSHQGKSLIAQYEENKKFNDLSRQILVDLAVNHMIQNNIKMTVNVAEKIADEIVAQFPTEIKPYYFIKIQGKPPLGKLYTKYFNQLRPLKSSGLMKKVSKRSEKNVENEYRDTIVDPETIADDLKEIKNDNCTWIQLEECWRKTAKYRVGLIKKAETTIQILNTWRAYKRPLGYKLVDIDFKEAKASNISELFPLYADKLKLIFEEKIKDPRSLQLLLQIKNEKNSNEDGFYATMFYLLHTVLHPTTKEIRKVDGKRQHVKFSIKDSQNSFLVVGNTLQEVESVILNWKVRNESVQPLLIIVGTVLNPKDILVYFDGIKYKMFTIIEEVDVCFKIFHVFNLQYPIQSILVWNSI